jgi:hypothetical protein
MGLSASVLRLMVRWHGQQPFLGPVLTLGMQDVHASYDELAAAFHGEGVRHQEVPPAQRQLSTSRYFRLVGLDGRGYVHPRVFFRMVGIDDYDDLDFADFEQPTLIHDLNRPVPEAWHGRFGLVLDGGTTEHVFDVARVFQNIAAMLKVGGDALHVSPMSGWVNHGFYQISPCVLYDFYAANGFEPLAAHLVQLPRDSSRYRETERPFHYTECALTLDDLNYHTLLIFRARKVRQMPLRLPTQGIYRPLANEEKRAG